MREAEKRLEESVSLLSEQFLEWDRLYHLRDDMSQRWGAGERQTDTRTRFVIGSEPRAVL